jgi:hypothetical protein
MATLVTFLLDRSGSMEAIKDDTIGAFNAYLTTLKTGGDGIEFSLIQFDSMSIDTMCVNAPIADAPCLDAENFQPRGSTPLIDAACKTIKAVEIALRERQIHPKVVICFQTDGRENASTEYTWTDLNALIKEKAALGWQFNFMGAGIDAYDQGHRMGFAEDNIVSYALEADATRAVFLSRAARTAAYARGAVPDMAFSPAEKRAAKDKFDPANKKGGAPRSAPAMPARSASPLPRRPIVDDIKL